MRLFGKASLAMAVLAISIAFVPAAKADPIVIQSGGFFLQNLGNDGTGVSGLDSLLGRAASSTHNINGTGSFIALLNRLTFTTGFTGAGSGGPHPFSFSQLLTINGQSQMLDISGSIDISHLVDTVHIISSTPLTFNFSTFTVAVDVIPIDLEGLGEGTFCSALKANFVVTRECNTVPEPATLTLLGFGLVGAAAKLRQRRKTRQV